MAQSQQPPQRTVPRTPPSDNVSRETSRESNGETEAERRERAAAEEKAARDQAEAATAHLGSPGHPGAPPLSPAEAGKEGEATVKMNFPHPVTLTLPGYRMVRFETGVQDVPQSIAEDDYLAASGATRV